MWDSNTGGCGTGGCGIAIQLDVEQVKVGQRYRWTPIQVEVGQVERWDSSDLGGCGTGGGGTAIQVDTDTGGCGTKTAWCAHGRFKINIAFGLPRLLRLSAIPVAT
jgi:hypothetical protein